MKQTEIERTGAGAHTMSPEGIREAHEAKAEDSKRYVVFVRTIHQRRHWRVVIETNDLNVAYEAYWMPGAERILRDKVNDVDIRVNAI